MKLKHVRLAVIGTAATLILGACGNAGEEDINPVDNKVEKNAASQFDDDTRMKEIADSGKITIGVKFDQPGLGFKKAGIKVPTGLDVEMGKVIAAKLGIKAEDVKWVQTVSDNREPFLQKNTVDFILASYSISDERRKVVGQAGPYYVTGQQLLVKKDSDIKTVKDIKGRNVCGVTGSLSLKQVEDKGAKARGFEAYAQCRDQVLDGGVDAMSTDGSILMGYVAQDPDELKVVGEPFSEERYGIGYSQDYPELCQFVNDAIKEAQDNGDWAKAFEATLGKSDVDTPDPPKMDSCP